MIPIVLVAEDSRPFRKVLEEYITEAGYKPVLAEDGWDCHLQRNLL